MDTYAEINEIEAQLPFSLDENSLPTRLYAMEIKNQAYRMINALIGVQTPDENLKAIEVDLVVNYCLALHTRRPANLRLTQLHKIILDNYLEEGLVSKGELYYGYD